MNMTSGSVPPVAPCFVSHNLALGGAQIAVLRMIRALPDWVRERTTLYVQAADMPLLEPALEAGFTCKSIDTSPPEDPSCWVLSYGNPAGFDPWRIAIQHLPRDTGHGRAAQIAIRAVDISPPFIVP